MIISKKKHVSAIGSTTTQIFKTIPQQIKTRIESLPPFHKKTYQSIIGCNNTGLFVKKQEIEKKDKKKPTYNSKDIPKVHTFSFLLLSLLVQRLNCLIFTSPPSKLPTKEEFSP